MFGEGVQPAKGPAVSPLGAAAPEAAPMQSHVSIQALHLQYSTAALWACFPRVAAWLRRRWSAFPPAQQSL